MIDARNAIAQAMMGRHKGSGILPARAVQPAFVPVVTHDEMSTIPAGPGTEEFNRAYRQAGGGGSSADEAKQREIAQMLIGFS
jgi:hypothetical protein